MQLEESSGLFKVRGTIDHPYPTTKIMWAPRALANTKDLLATTGDYLRIWSVGDAEEVTMVSYLNNNRGSDYCAPLTSFDWSSEEPSTIATCSIDTTCTIWDITTEKIRTQLIAHDKEVNDIAFSKSKHIFGTVGSDGSLRVFDLRYEQGSVCEGFAQTRRESDERESDGALRERAELKQGSHCLNVAVTSPLPSRAPSAGRWTTRRSSTRHQG